MSQYNNINYLLQENGARILPFTRDSNPKFTIANLLDSDLEVFYIFSITYINIFE